MKEASERNQLPLFEGEQPEYLEVKISGSFRRRGELTAGHRKNGEAYYLVRTTTKKPLHDDDSDGVPFRGETAKVVEAFEVPTEEGFDYISRLREEEARLLDEILGTDRFNFDDPKVLSAEEIERIQERMNEAGVGMTVGLNDEGVLVDLKTGEPAIEALQFMDPRPIDQAPDDDAAPIASDAVEGITSIDKARARSLEKRGITPEAVALGLELEGREDPKVVEQDGKLLWMHENGQVELNVTDAGNIVDAASGEILGGLPPAAR